MQGCAFFYTGPDYNLLPLEEWLANGTDVGLSDIQLLTNCIMQLEWILTNWYTKCHMYLLSSHYLFI